MHSDMSLTFIYIRPVNVCGIIPCVQQISFHLTDKMNAK